MLLWGKGVVTKLLRATETKQIVELLDEAKNLRQAINFPLLTGECLIGDEVLFNKTAVELNLGTGGYDFIIANVTNPPIERKKTQEHIMKNRYTPLQLSIHAGEEEHFEEDEEWMNLGDLPVLIISLHSMLPILCLTIHHAYPDCNIVYIMTDATSLPIWLSDHVEILQEQKMLQGTITIGQSFGGDIEAINKFSGLQLAKKIYQPNYVIIGPGPGSVGTGNKWGTSAIEIGEIVNAVYLLGGKPIIVPRISFAEQRSRHFGLSHHIITALANVTFVSAHLPLPLLAEDKHQYIYHQVKQANLMKKHKIHWITKTDVDTIKERINGYKIPITTMGRTIDEDAEYFQGIVAAASFVRSL